MNNKKTEDHAVAGARSLLKDRLRTFEGKLWIDYDNHELECDKERRLGESRYREAVKQQQAQIIDLMLWKSRVMSVLADSRFRKLVHRTGGPAGMLEWSVDFGVVGHVVADSLEDVLEKSFSAFNGKDGDDDVQQS